MQDRDTIAAIASAAGRGGIGIVRLSGPRAKPIGERICGRALEPRHARHARFRDRDGAILDDGIALLFAAPASYTGEDVVELQAHGSPVLLHELLETCCALGARRARAGEFSQRAWENGRLDLAQAEAVADLIAAGDLHAARAARRSLEGEFSQRVDALARALLALRVQLEASIDFADEELDADGEAALRRRLDAARAQLDALLAAAEQGRRLRDGLHAVIVGPPNAGKSSLLNALAGSDRAIVADLPGTTRDLLQETIRVDGVELTLVDTAGLREEGDAIEREGMRRARAELARADALFVPLFFNQGGEHLLKIARTLDALDVHLRRGLVRRAQMHRAKAPQPLAEAALERDVQNAVKPYLLLGAVEKPRVHQKLILRQLIARKRPRQAEDDAFAVLPKDVCHMPVPL